MHGLRQVRPTITSLLQPRHTLQTAHSRWLHRPAASSTPETSLPPVPSPTPLVPDVPTFLKVIGRGFSEHAAKFPTWEALFTLTSPQLKELGIDPVRNRRYLLQWRNRFRLGKFGPGGDLQHVEDGVAELRVCEDKTDPVAPRRYVVNVPAGKSMEEVPAGERVRPRDYKVEGPHTICGPYAIPLKGNGGARVTVTEAMWEQRRGRKIDGGERRQKEVRFKRRVAERRAAREAKGFH